MNGGKEKKEIVFNKLNALFREALEKKVFPGAAVGVALGLKGKRERFIATYGLTSRQGKKGVAVTPGVVFDLASLTKPLATTLAVLSLLRERNISPDSKLADLFPVEMPHDKKQITVRQLLRHSSGLPAHRPYFQKIQKVAREERKEAFLSLVLKEPLDYPTDRKALYSDLGFMLLGWLIEEQTGMGLEQYVREKILKPLDLGGQLFFNPGNAPQKRIYAATEECPWRGRVLQGEVSDENCFAMGGVAGHAGLFGTIDGVLSCAGHLLDQWHEKSAHPSYGNRDLKNFLTRQKAVPGSTWALGFDTPSSQGSSAGRYFSPKSVGHLGFTGTSFWIDPERQFVVVLLSNRVHPGRENELIKEFRPLFHDIVAELFRLT